MPLNSRFITAKQFSDTTASMEERERTVDAARAVYKSCGIVEESKLGHASDHVAEFILVGDEIFHKETGKPLAEWIAGDLRVKWPTLWPTKHEKGTAYKAFVLGDITACGLLFQQIGEDAFNALMKRYGITRPGEKGKEPDESEDEAIDRSTRAAHLRAELAKLEGDEPAAKKAGPGPNPWAAKSFSIQGQGEYVKRWGMDRATAAARAVGCVIGSTRPNPKYS
jgi:hypothetical protein